MAEIKEIARKRRYVTREYNITCIRRLFNIPTSEMITDLRWNRTENKIMVDTLINWDTKKGDI